MATPYTLWLCQDCTFLSVNGDPEQDALTDRRREDIVSGLDCLAEQGNLAPNFDSNADGDAYGIQEFSKTPCDCCQSHLAGYRARFALFPKGD